MTQDVQPLTYQHRTNIEEHRQFFSKINEIIDNLAPTVAEAEAATAQANSAIATANAASDNANSAVDTANAASASAQASATTVSGYAARLAAIEASYIKNVSSDVQTIDSDLQVTNGHDLAVAGDVNVAGGVNASGQSEIAGMAIEKSGNATTLSNDNGINTSSPFVMRTLNVTGTATIAAVPTSTTGARDTAPVNGVRLQNDLDAYASMIRTTGAQVKRADFGVSGNFGCVSLGKGGRYYKGSSGSAYIELCRLKAVNSSRYILEFSGGSNASNSLSYGLLMITTTASGTPLASWVFIRPSSYRLVNPDNFKLVHDSTAETLSVYVLMNQYEAFDYLIKKAYTQSVPEYDGALVRAEFTPNDLSSLDGLTLIEAGVMS